MRFIVLKGFGPLDYQMGSWGAKYEVLAQEMFGSNGALLWGAQKTLTFDATVRLTDPLVKKK